MLDVFSLRKTASFEICFAETRVKYLNLSACFWTFVHRIARAEMFFGTPAD